MWATAAGESLPGWLSFDPQSSSFVASSVPNGALPIEVVVTVGNRSWTISITDSK